MWYCYKMFIFTDFQHEFKHEKWSRQDISVHALLLTHSLMKGVKQACKSFLMQSSNMTTSRVRNRLFSAFYGHFKEKESSVYKKQYKIKM